MTRGRVLAAAFYDRDALEVAPELLNKVLVHDDPTAGRLAVRLVEVEAYRGAADPGSHAFTGQTPRNSTMFGRPGHLYVYFTYGMHWCANAVCGPGRTPQAVLLRAGSPIQGEDAMYARRSVATRARELASGPAKLTQALGLDGEHDGVSIRRGAVRVVDDDTPPPQDPGVSRRIGISAGRGDELEWRFYVRHDENVSRRPRD